MIYPTGLSTQAFDDAITSGKETQILITFNDDDHTQFSNSNISADGIQINSYFNSENNLHYGGFYSREIIINFINSSAFDDLDWTKSFVVTLNVEISGSNKSITLGSFRGEKPKIYANSPKIQFIAYDELYYADKTKIATDLKSSLPVNYTYADLLYYAGLGMGIELTSPYNLLDYFTDEEYHVVPRYPFRNGLTYGEIIREIADANLLNIVCDPTGIKLKRLSKPNNTRSGNYKVKYSNCYQLQIEESEIWNYNKIIISNVSTETDYTYPSNQPSYTNYYKFVDNNLLLDCLGKSTLCSEMLNKLQSSTVFSSGFYKPMTVEVDGGVCVEPGDIIPVEIDENGTTIDMPVFKISFYWNGSCRCVYECTGDNNRGLTKDQQNSYELNGVIENSFTRNFNSSLANNLITTTEGYALDARQGKVLNDNLTDLANIHPSPFDSVSALVNAVNDAPDNYLMFAYGSTLGNILTGRSRIGYGTARKSGADYVLYDVCDSYGEHFCGWIYIPTEAVTQRQLAFFYIGDSLVDMLAKAKIQGERTFTFYAGSTLANALCGESSSSFGTCMYSNGYLMWELITFNDEKYRGWYKESDGSTKVYIEGKSNTGIIQYYTKTGVSIPNNAEFTVDLSSNIPSGYEIWDANVQILYNGNAWYHLPYFSNSMDRGMWIQRITGGKITIRCSDAGWGTCDIAVTAFLRHS